MREQQQSVLCNFKLAKPLFFLLARKLISLSALCFVSLFLCAQTGNRKHTHNGASANVSQNTHTKELCASTLIYDSNIKRINHLVCE